jgi:hypothetical protein
MNSPQNIPTHDAITSRARAIWESSGRIEGQDMNNWLRAEKELLSEAASSARMDKAEAHSVAPEPKASPVQQPLPPAQQSHEDGNRVRGKQARLRR